MYSLKRCPLYSRDSTQEHQEIPQEDQDEELKDIKDEVKKEEEETLLSGDQQSMEEEERIMKTEQEESSLHADTNGRHEVSHITQHRTYRVETSMDPSNPNGSSDRSHPVTSDIHHSSHSADPSIHEESPLNREGDHTEESSLSCLECGKCFKMKSEVREMFY
ncbi:uncharacterized protein ACMZJ9_015079 [Mantella aurantiaca]